MNEVTMVTVNTSLGKLMAREDGEGIIHVELPPGYYNHTLTTPMDIAASEWAKLGALGAHVDPNYQQMIEFVRKMASFDLETPGVGLELVECVREAAEIIDGPGDRSATESASTEEEVRSGRLPTLSALEAARGGEKACTCPGSIREKWSREITGMVGGATILVDEVRYGPHHSVGCPRYAE